MSVVASGRFLGSEIGRENGDDAAFHVLPVPFEKSVSYGRGTALGARAIIAASDQLETFDQIDGEPCRLGIHTHRALDCHGEVGEVLERVRAATREVVQRGKLPFVLGGEHTLSYGAVMGVVDACPDEKIGIVQFDAHADLRESYEGSVWSHACVMKRLVDEGLPLFQLGVRAISREEQTVRHMFSAGIGCLDAMEICRPVPRHQFALPEHFPRRIYLTVDIDVLDSAVMPATGTPVPGGLSFRQTVDLIANAAQGREIVAMDLVEYAPIDNMHAYDYTAADLAYKMMGIAARASILEEKIGRY